jgi:hypothetical protein
MAQILGQLPNYFRSGGPAQRSLQLHDGQVTVSIDSQKCQVIMQIDEKKDSKPIIFDLANNTISNVTVIPPE